MNPPVGIQKDHRKGKCPQQRGSRHRRGRWVCAQPRDSGHRHEMRREPVQKIADGFAPRSVICARGRPEFEHELARAIAAQHEPERSGGAHATLHHPAGGPVSLDREDDADGLHPRRRVAPGPGGEGRSLPCDQFPRQTAVQKEVARWPLPVLTGQDDGHVRQDARQAVEKHIMPDTFHRGVRYGRDRLEQLVLPMAAPAPFGLCCPRERHGRRRIAVKSVGCAGSQSHSPLRSA